MPRKGSKGSICSRCGCTKNPSGYCPTCYQIKKSSSSTPSYTYTRAATVKPRAATVQPKGICSKCGHNKNPSGYCPTCYQIKKSNTSEPSSLNYFTTAKAPSPRTCSQCGCAKNPSGYCPTCYQLKKKKQSTPVAKISTDKAAHMICSKCGYAKNPSGYCPTCYQIKKQEKEECAAYTVSLAEDFVQVSTPIERVNESGYISSNSSPTKESTTASSPETITWSNILCSKCGCTKNSSYCQICNEEEKQESIETSLEKDFLLVGSPIKREDDSGCVIISDVEDELLPSDSNPDRKTASPTRVNSATSTTPNKSTPTKAPTTTSSKKPTTTDAKTQATPLRDIPTIPPSTQPIGTSPVTVTTLDEQSTEWTYISKRMLQTMPQTTTIQRIYKVHNEWLMERYKLAKRRMLWKYNNKITEKILFHGTSKIPPLKIINSEFGFDFRHCSKGLWGIGTYFAVNANYSNSYSYKPEGGQGYREILAVWVLTGESYRCEPDKTLRRPPAKSSNSAESYDTVCGHVGDSDVYVVYDHEKAYPSYIVQYTV